VSLTVGFVLAAVVVAALLGAFDIVDYAGLLVMSIVFGVAYMSIAVSLSSLTSSTTMAGAAMFGVFVLFYVVWNALQQVFRLLSQREILFFDTVSYTAEIGGQEVQAERLQDWVYFVMNLDPGQAYTNGLTLLTDVDALESQVAYSAQLFGGELPIFLQDWFSFLILLFWIVVPPRRRPLSIRSRRSLSGFAIDAAIYFPVRTARLPHFRGDAYVTGRGSRGRDRLHLLRRQGRRRQDDLRCGHRVSLAAAGRRTLVVSTDPAHSLADSFEADIGPEPTELEAPTLLEGAETAATRKARRRPIGEPLGRRDRSRNAARALRETGASAGGGPAQRWGSVSLTRRSRNSLRAARRPAATRSQRSTCWSSTST